MFKKAAFLMTMLLMIAIASANGDDKKPEGKAARFEQFKQLVGEWEGSEKDGKDGHKMKITYKLTSGGSAIVETIAPGTEHEMVTMIHPDGDDILLTHYCMLGNQPQMKASGKGATDKVEFSFTHATNMKSDKDMHMHNVTFYFVDKDHVKTEWTHFMDGKDAGKVVFDLKRVK